MTTASRETRIISINPRHKHLRLEEIRVHQTSRTAISMHPRMMATSQQLKGKGTSAMKQRSQTDMNRLWSDENHRHHRRRLNIILATVWTMNYNGRVFQRRIKALGLYNRELIHLIFCFLYHHCLLILMNILVRMDGLRHFLQCDDIRIHFLRVRVAGRRAVILHLLWAIFTTTGISAL